MSRITEADKFRPPGELTSQQMNLQREVAACTEIVRLSALGDWEETVQQVLGAIQARLDLPENTAPQPDEERHQWFKITRQIVQMLVERVELGKGQKLYVVSRLDMLSPISQPSALHQAPQVGTCSHIR